MKDRFNIIGRDVPRTDAEAKARGSAIYTDDMKLPGLLSWTDIEESIGPCPNQAHRYEQGFGASRG